MANGWDSAVRGGAPVGDREIARAAERDRRSAERIAAAQARSEQRQADRDGAMQRREAERQARAAEEDARRAARTVEREERPKRRSGTGSLARTGEKPVERDTRHYATDVDVERIRMLAGRGASIDGLAKAFGIPVEAVEDALNDA